MNSTSETRGTILMLLSIVCFTVNTLAIRALSLHFPDCNGWQVTLFRGLAGTLVVIFFFSKGRGLRLAALYDRPKIIWRGILGATGVAIFYVTIIHLGPARAVVINLSYPVFAALLAALFLKESLGTQKLVWILTGFTGLIIFVGPKSLEGGISFFDLLAIAGALIAAGVVVLIRTLHRSEHSATIFASQAIYCIILAAPLSTSSTLSLPPLALIGLALAGIIVAGGQLAMTFAYRHLEVSKGASMQMLLPIATALGAWLLFDEKLEAIEISGAALTLLATLMVNRQASKALLKMPSQPIPIHDNH
ncbi:DMT family transporter [Verrucomicrobiaceae bacterium 227]